MSNQLTRPQIDTLGRAWKNAAKSLRQLQPIVDAHNAKEIWLTEEQSGELIRVYAELQDASQRLERMAMTANLEKHL